LKDEIEKQKDEIEKQKVEIKNEKVKTTEERIDKKQLETEYQGLLSWYAKWKAAYDDTVFGVVLFL
jgi:hypothetical protein